MAASRERIAGNLTARGFSQHCAEQSKRSSASCSANRARFPTTVMAASEPLLTETVGLVPAESVVGAGGDGEVTPALAEFISRVVVPLLVARLLALGGDPPSGGTLRLRLRLRR